MKKIFIGLFVLVLVSSFVFAGAGTEIRTDPIGVGSVQVEEGASVVKMQPEGICSFEGATILKFRPIIPSFIQDVM